MPTVNGYGEDAQLMSNTTLGCDVARLEVTIRIPNMSHIRDFYEPVLNCLGYSQTDNRPGLSRWASGSGCTNLVLIETAETSGADPIHLGGLPHTSRVVFAADSAQQVHELYSIVLEIGANVLVSPLRYRRDRHEHGVVFCHAGGTILELRYRRQRNPDTPFP